MNKVIYIIIALCIFGCAGQRPPGGGPIDTISPEVIYSYPENLSTNIITDKIILDFSEYVDKRSVEESIYISPSIKNIEYKWNENKLTIHLIDKLQKNTTYVLNIGTDVVDLNNRNRMNQTFTIAFSTGNKIDNGQISGKVFASDPSGIMIYAFKNSNVAELNLTKNEPSYITQSGKNGEYIFTNLSNGSYSVFAIKDEFRNILYDIEIDEIGIPSNQININQKDTLFEKINFKLFKEDSTKPRLLNAEMIDINHLKLKFSEEINFNFPNKISLFYNGKSDNGTRELALLNSKNELIVIDNFNNDLSEIKIEKIFDIENNEIDEKINSSKINYVSIPDTTPPKIIFSNIENNKIYDSVNIIQLQFDDEVFINDKSFVLTNDNNKIIGLKINKIHKSKVEIIPSENLIGGKYSLKIFAKEILNLNNIRGTDSVRYINFEIISSERYGSIKGIMKRLDIKNLNMIIRLKNTSYSEIEYLTKLNQSNEFEIQNIMEGDYLLSYYEDLNNNDKWDKGTLKPFAYSEKYFEYPDKIKIRARWPLEGIILK